MKKSIKTILIPLYFSVAAIAITQLASCGSDPAPSAQDAVASKLTGFNWVMQSVNVDNVDQTAVYRGLTIRFSTTGFTTTNGGAVWPTSGSWSFNSPDGTSIKRNDGIIVAVDAKATTLKLTLNWPNTTLGGGRSNSVGGVNVFNFMK